MSNRTVVMGVDLSQTGLGLVAVPEDWDLRWDRIAHTTVGRTLTKGAPPWDAISRLEYLADQVVDFASRNDISHVWIESYPVGGRVFALDKLCEIGGVVRVALHRELRLIAHTAPLSTARKLVMGKLPRAKVKDLLHEQVRSYPGMCLRTGDEIDAWVAANYGMSLLGGCTVAAEAA